MRRAAVLLPLLTAVRSAAFLSPNAPHMFRAALRSGAGAQWRPLQHVWRDGVVARGAHHAKRAGPVAEETAGARKGRRRSRSSGTDTTEVTEGAKLLIVESATKAQTIKKFLPTGWDVDFCMGHVRELPRSMSDLPQGAKEKFEVLGVRVHEGFEPVWVVLPAKETIVNRLRTKAKSCSELFLATDEDREGEAISWHLVDLLKPTVPYHRVVFHEITRDAVEGGLAQPRQIDQSLVEAQHARRVLDRVAGYTMSPLLWKKIGLGLSAGRVQSAGLKLLVDRERERMLFRSAAYAALKVALKGTEPGKELEARLQAVNGKRVATGPDFNPRTGQLLEKKLKSVVWIKEDEMGALGKSLTAPGTKIEVIDIDTKIITRKRPAPFTTSTLQQDANSRLGLASAQTMKLAQELYEEGYISYMRTDNPNMGPEAQKVASGQALDTYGPLDAHTQTESLKRNAASATAQEAHEAIRPSIIDGRFRLPRELSFDDRKKQELYQLIFERTLASVMKDAKMERKSVSIHATTPDGTEVDLVLSGQVVKLPGFLRAFRDMPDPDAEEDDSEPPMLADNSITKLKPGQKLTCHGTTVLPKSTSPPYRFTQGSFVRVLEELGIGRPSTYSSIIEVLKTRRYFNMKGNQMVPTVVGFVVTQLLERHFPDFVDASFTSRMETDLDSIANGDVQRQRYLMEYYKGLTSAIDMVIDTIDRKFAKRVVLSTLQDAPCGIFVGPYGPYARDLLPGEPTDAQLLQDEATARAYYQELWSNDDQYIKSTTELRRTPLPAGMRDDPGVITKEALMGLLDMTVNGMLIGKDPETGANVILRSNSKLGRSLEMAIPGTDEVRRLQVPSTVNDTCSLDLALRMINTFPRSLGVHPSTGEEMVLNLGYYPNLRMGNLSYGLMNHSVEVLLDMTPAEAVEVVNQGKATCYLGDHKGSSIWFVPKRQYTYPHIRWNQAKNQLKLYLKEEHLGPDGRPTLETALRLIESKVSGGKRGKSKKEPADAGSSKTPRPPTAFQLYCKDHRGSLERGLSLPDQQKALAARWKALSEESDERKRFMDSAAELKAQADASKNGGVKKAPKTAERSGPRSSYQLFCEERRKELQPGMRVTEQAKELSKLWRGLTDAERQQYAKRVEAMKKVTV